MTNRIKQTVQLAKDNEEWVHEYMMTIVREEPWTERRGEGRSVLAEIIKIFNRGMLVSEFIQKGIVLGKITLVKSLKSKSVESNL